MSWEGGLSLYQEVNARLDSVVVVLSQPTNNGTGCPGAGRGGAGSYLCGVAGSCRVGMGWNGMGWDERAKKTGWD